MRSAIRAAGAVVATVLLMAACGDSGGEADSGAERQVPPSGEVASPAAGGPDTTGAAVWSHLEEQRYRDTWRMWPGKDRLYAGTEPHGMLLTTYVNPTARDALVSGQVANLPVGSIIVKENWMSDSTYAAATVMYKVRGFNPEHQDWLFAKYDPQGTPEAFGRDPMCQACHQSAPSGYIYTSVER